MPACVPVPLWVVLLIGEASCLIDGFGWGIFRFDFFSLSFMGLAVAQGGKERNAISTLHFGQITTKALYQFLSVLFVLSPS